MYLSVAASAVSAFAVVALSSVLSTTVGSGFTASFFVVNVTAAFADTLLFVSTASTSTVYSVPSVRPVSTYSVAVSYTHLTLPTTPYV